MEEETHCAGAALDMRGVDQCESREAVVLEPCEMAASSGGRKHKLVNHVSVVSLSIKAGEVIGHRIRRTGWCALTCIRAFVKMKGHLWFLCVVGGLMAVTSATDVSVAEQWSTFKVTFKRSFSDDDVREHKDAWDSLLSAVYA